MSDLLKLFDFEEIRVHRLPKNTNFPASYLLGGKGEGDWRIIDFSATEDVGMVLLGKLKPQNTEGKTVNVRV